MELMPASDTNTMTSREVAEVTGKSHKHVLEDIRTAIRSLESEDGHGLLLDDVKKSSYVGGNRRTLDEYIMGRNFVLLLTSGYSVSLRARVVARLHEHETESAFVRLANKYESRIKTLESQSKDMKALPAAVIMPLSPWQVANVRNKVHKIGGCHLAPKEKCRLIRSTYAWIRKAHGVKSYKDIISSEYDSIMKELTDQSVKYRKQFAASFEKGLCPVGHSISEVENIEYFRKVRKALPAYRTPTEMASAWHPSGSNGMSAIGKIIKRSLGDLDTPHRYKVNTGRATSKGRREVFVSLYSPDVQKIVYDILNPPTLFDEKEF